MLFCHVLSRKARAFIHFKTARLMLPHFTWTDYSLAVAVIGIVYYLIVGALFYRQEIKTFSARKTSFGSGRRSLPRAANQLSEPEAVESEKAERKRPPWQNEEVFGKVEELAQQIRISISEACQKGYERRDLIFLIQLLIKYFSAIKGSPFRPAIDNVITSESAKYGFINLSAVELEEVWKEV